MTTTNTETEWTPKTLDEAVSAAWTERQLADEEQKKKEAAEKEARDEKLIEEFRKEFEALLADVLCFADVSYSVRSRYYDDYDAVEAKVSGRVNGRDVSVPVCKRGSTYSIGKHTTIYERAAANGGLRDAVLLALRDQTLNPPPAPPAPRKMAVFDGGSAFPSSEDQADGITERDYFAAKALAGMLHVDNGTCEEIAKEAYRLADAMLTEKRRRIDAPAE